MWSPPEFKSRPPIFTLNMCTLADNKSVSLHWSQKVLWNIEKKAKMLTHTHTVLCTMPLMDLWLPRLYVCVFPEIHRELLHRPVSGYVPEEIWKKAGEQHSHASDQCT